LVDFLWNFVGFLPGGAGRGILFIAADIAVAATFVCGEEYVNEVVPRAPQAQNLSVFIFVCFVVYFCLILLLLAVFLVFRTKNHGTFFCTYFIFKFLVHIFCIILFIFV
jgi:hypothetical protein